MVQILLTRNTVQANHRCNVHSFCVHLYTMRYSSTYKIRRKALRNSENRLKYTAMTTRNQMHRLAGMSATTGEGGGVRISPKFGQNPRLFTYFFDE